MFLRQSKGNKEWKPRQKKEVIGVSENEQLRAWLGSGNENGDKTIVSRSMQKK